MSEIIGQKHIEKGYAMKLVNIQPDLFDEASSLVKVWIEKQGMSLLRRILRVEIIA